MTKISFKPIDIMRETYEPSLYKDLNHTRPALKLEEFEIANHLLIPKIVLISSHGVKGYNNTCLCAYLAYLNDSNTSKTKKG